MLKIANDVFYIRIYEINKMCLNCYFTLIVLTCVGEDGAQGDLNVRPMVKQLFLIENLLIFINTYLKGSSSYGH